MSRVRRDAGERERRLRTEAETEHQRAVMILESMTDAFLAFDSDWRLTYMNSGAERLARSSREEYLGQNLWELFPALLGGVESEWRRALEDRTPVQYETFDQLRRRWYEVRAYPSSGELRFSAKTSRKRKAAESAIRISNDALRASQFRTLR